MLGEDLEFVASVESNILSTVIGLPLIKPKAKVISMPVKNVNPNESTDTTSVWVVREFWYDEGEQEGIHAIFKNKEDALKCVEVYTKEKTDEGYNLDSLPTRSNGVSFEGSEFGIRCNEFDVR
jgi:hypothetical protein